MSRPMQKHLGSKQLYVTLEAHQWDYIAQLKQSLGCKTMGDVASKIISRTLDKQVAKQMGLTVRDMKEWIKG